MSEREPFTSTVVRAAPRRRLWYWEARRPDGRVVAAGYQKFKADAEKRAADEVALAKGIDRQLAEAARNGVL